MPEHRRRFPKVDDALRRKRMQDLRTAIIVGLLVAAVLAAAIYFLSLQPK